MALCRLTAAREGSFEFGAQSKGTFWAHLAGPRNLGVRKNERGRKRPQHNAQRRRRRAAARVCAGPPPGWRVVLGVRQAGSDGALGTARDGGHRRG